MRNRPRSQWVASGITGALLLVTVILWVGQLTRVLTGCADGLGNPGLTGQLTGGHCVLSDGEPLVELPWHEDLWITVLLTVALACVVAAVLVPRGTVSRTLAVLAVPVLLYAGFSMGARARQRADGEVFSYVAGSAEARGSSAVPGGWELNVSGRDVVLPDVGLTPVAVGVVGGLALLAMVAMLLRDRQPG